MVNIVAFSIDLFFWKITFVAFSWLKVPLVAFSLKVYGLGFRILGLGFSVKNIGFTICELGFEVLCLGLRVFGLTFGI